ncbi:MAG: hypothetical protein AAFX05_02380 [Planctomycetota bacterium]
MHVLTTIVLVLGIVSSAQAQQSAADLRREIDLLKQRIAQLEAQLDRAREENKQLHEENQKLRGTRPAGTPRPSTTPAGTPEDAPDADEPIAAPDDPFASPEALLTALKMSYEEQFADDPGARGPQRVAEVRRWTRDAQREFRRRIEWVIEIDSADGAPPATAPIPFFVVDAETGQRLHRDPVSVRFPARFQRRIIDDSGQEHWSIIGMLAATPKVNPDRVTSGFIDVPPFIGAYAEFEFDLRVNAVSPADDPASDP